MLKSIVISCAMILSGFAVADQGVDKESAIIPASKTVSPQYPASAHRKGMSGYVLVNYSVDENGKARNITVVEEEPRRVFSKAAVRALKRSRFDVASATDAQMGEQKKLYVFDVQTAQPARTRVAQN